MKSPHVDHLNLAANPPRNQPPSDRESLALALAPAPHPTTPAPPDPSDLSITQVIPYLGRAQGGPVISLASLAGALCECGGKISVLATRLASDGELMAFDPRVNLTTLSAHGALGFRRCPGLRAALISSISNSTNNPGSALIHSHSLWTDANRVAAAVARASASPHIISICGALAPDALRRRAWKKWPARVAFQDAALDNAAALHAKSEKEAAEIRAFGLRAPIAIIPNSIAGPPMSGVPSQAEFRREHGIPGDARIALYVGRLHPVKGVARLIEAWAALPRLLKVNWRLVLAGPDEIKHRHALQSRAAELHLTREIHFIGPLDDTAKWAAYRAADFFVMPSEFENFGLAIAEAMLAGTPPLTNTRAPWESLVPANAGWSVEPGVEALRDGLERAMSLPDQARRDMGRRAQAIAARFRPEAIATQMIAVYHWALRGGPRPDCVHLD